MPIPAAAIEFAKSCIREGWEDDRIAIRCRCTPQDIQALREELDASVSPAGEQTHPDAVTDAVVDFALGMNKVAEATQHLIKCLDFRLTHLELEEYLAKTLADVPLPKAELQRLAEQLLKDFAIIPRIIKKETDAGG